MVRNCPGRVRKLEQLLTMLHIVNACLFEWILRVKAMG
jgi:hypothetical protein